MPLAALLGAAALTLGACASDRSAAGSSFQPVRPGVLTVATAFLPAPGFWQGRPPTFGLEAGLGAGFVRRPRRPPPTFGLEAGLAAALARRLGLHRVEVVQVPFAQLVRGKLHGADIALSQLTPTKERERSVDFTTAYLDAPPGVLARKG